MRFCVPYKILCRLRLWSWGSAITVTVVARQLTGWLRSHRLTPSKGRKSFTSPKHVDQLWGPPKFIFRWYWCSVQGVKQLEYEANQLPLSSTGAKNYWCYVFATCICLFGICRDRFTFSVFMFFNSWLFLCQALIKQNVLDSVCIC